MPLPPQLRGFQGSNLGSHLSASFYMLSSLAGPQRGFQSCCLIFFFFYLDHLHIKWPHSFPVPGPPSPGQVITLFHMNCHPQCDSWYGQACGHNCEGLSRLACVGIVLTMLVHGQTLTIGTVPRTGHLGVKVS